MTNPWNVTSFHFDPFPSPLCRVPCKRLHRRRDWTKTNWVDSNMENLNSEPIDRWRCEIRQSSFGTLPGPFVWEHAPKVFGCFLSVRSPRKKRKTTTNGVKRWDILLIAHFVFECGHDPEHQPTQHHDSHTEGILIVEFVPPKKLVILNLPVQHQLVTPSRCALGVR